MKIINSKKKNGSQIEKQKVCLNVNLSSRLHLKKKFIQEKSTMALRPEDRNRKQMSLGRNVLQDKVRIYQDLSPCFD